MAAPINTYNSEVDLGLGQVPQVEDSELYQGLLDIHNAIEALASYIDDSSSAASDFLAKFRAVKVVTTDYSVQPQDGIILVNASANDVTITLPPSELNKGYRYTVKVIQWSYPHQVTVVGATVEGAVELIDEHTNGVKVSSLSAYTFVSKSTDASLKLTGYAII